ncbi:hypothetical protein FNF29_04245 [Cafeteria roenbergensis]|uniref:Uncharacterized protein n=1 Tax=Cafeteria roenbergensis TaxID=33653 RepID=A0A5A8CGT3_CAFRO|nr:hypothetical protein FNF29_04245 [Cafeteria roenbergensis]|eukprot:KAA0151839.1 hypothetical protein FNF29_04245 [Cafeteria roenbergensis]
MSAGDASAAVKAKALLAAVKLGDVAEAEKLLDSGTPIESADKNAWTALVWACRGGNIAMARMLLDRGAEIEARGSGGWTPLSWAVRSGSEAVTALLLDRGADLEAKDTGGWTALLWAAMRGHADVAELLLRRGAALADEDGEDADVEALCHYPECLLVLRDADRIQRWHRRRLLALWWHRISQPHGPKGGS